MSERSEEAVGPLATIILDCVHREYPNQVALGLRSDDDLAPPRELHPAFYGSFDWHSSVHGHWSLARASRVLPGGELRDRCLAALATSLTRERIEGELDYYRDRPGFECPYGIAWLLLLAAELESIETPSERDALAPLAELAERNFVAYLGRLTHPVRSGQHDQSAFSMGLALDVARRRGHAETERAIVETTLRLHHGDRDAPLHFEPSNHDFLSPALAEADLMRRVLAPVEFPSWLERFLPGLPPADPTSWLTPIGCPDPSDGRISHRIGLNLSRAWMLAGIARALGPDDARTPALAAAGEQHRTEGLAAIDPRHYAGAHWLGTFGIYLLTGGSEPGKPPTPHP